MTRSGACDCGRATYRVTAESLLVYACHCRRCQTRSGSAFAEHAMVPETAFALDGETLTFVRETGGVSFQEVMCASCGTRIFNRNAGLPGMVFVAAGTLTDSDRIRPMAHIWTRRKQPWVEIPAGVATFTASPTPEEFEAAAALARPWRSRRGRTGVAVRSADAPG